MLRSCLRKKDLMKHHAVALSFLMLTASGLPPAHAADINVTAPWLRATPPHASVAGGYATIINTSKTADRLLGATLPMAPDGQVHAMSMTNGVMHMERLADGLPIPPGATVSLTPGGYHLMFVKPTAQLHEGDTVQGTLIFEKAGKIAATFHVAGVGAKQPPDTPAPHDMGDMHGMGDMPGMDMKAK
jgi:copper(I)-binding protein